ncbi:hypothetical protein Tco_0909596 [Tanacetum coccineum]|uniref:Uncharacterized protein n=1 Tax=Tanacetum coccineum TaxID=301880 RepID=A0ABQ5CQF9_9ASTR
MPLCSQNYRIGAREFLGDSRMRLHDTSDMQFEHSNGSSSEYESIRMRMTHNQPANVDSDEDSSYDYAFISEVQTPSTSYMNDDHEQTYHEPPKIINSTIGDDQINRNIIFDDPNMKVNNSCVDDDKYVHDPYELEQLA